MDAPRSVTPPPPTSARDADAVASVAAAAMIDGGMRTAASVASYFRSAIRRRGELFASPRSAASAVNEADEADEVVGRQPKPASESDDTQSSSEYQSPSQSASPTALDRTTSSESLRSPSSVHGHAFDPSASASSHASRQYEVLCDRDVLSDDDEQQEPKPSLSLMQSDAGKTEFVDVLLQGDANGLGLNIAVGASGVSDAVVVQSFRRLHARDVGPAEASGKIRVGDHLLSVDGERMASIRQLYAKVSGVADGSFLLLRFLRPAASTETLVTTSESSSADEEESEEKAAPTAMLDVEYSVRDNPQVSTLVRDLVAANRRLQDQLLASRLKQDELSIQLDQLYSLYARTQLDGGLTASFSLPKTLRPFAWRNGNRSAALDDGMSGRHPLGINRSAYSSKVLLEIEDAVGAEYERLRRNFELQFSLDKQQLERRFAEKSAKLEAAMDKKVAMLQAGFEHVAWTSSGRRGGSDARSCSCGVEEDQGTESSIEEGRRHRQREVRQGRKTRTTYDAEELSSRRRLDQIVGILDAYRRQRVDCVESGSNGDVFEENKGEVLAVITTSGGDGAIETLDEKSKHQEVPETVEAAESGPVAC